MGVLTLDPNVLLRRWIEIYMNLNVLRHTDPDVTNSLNDMKEKLAECNEYVMAFFDHVGADPEKAN